MINNTYKPLQSFNSPSGSFQSLSPGLFKPKSISLSSISPLNSRTSPQSTSPSPKNIALANGQNSVERTPSGGTVERINGGAAYSNPLDNPNYRPTASTAQNGSGVAGLASSMIGSAPTQNASFAQNQGAQSPVRGLFPTVVASLAGRSIATPAAAATAGLTDIANKPNDAFELAQRNLQDFRNKYANQLANNAMLPLGVEEQTGREAIMGRQAAVQESALQQAVANTLQRQGLNIQALQGAGNIANASQQIGLAGLGSAAGLAQPAVAGYGQTVFNPVTGEFAGGGNELNPQSAAADLAQKVVSGQMTYEQAVSSLGYAGSAGQQFLNNAIKTINPSFNIPASSASTVANADVVNKATSDISNMQTNLQAADSNLAQLTNLAAENGINDLSTVTGNKILNLFKGEFSNQALYSFNALLAGTRALYAAVLESRANLSPTDAYNAAVQQVPDNVNLDALRGLTQTLKSEAQNIISAKQQQIQNVQGANGGGINNGNATQPAGWF